jgi:hypothetical protein
MNSRMEQHFIQLQCVECWWKHIGSSGHCYMFKKPPTEVCAQRRLDIKAADTVELTTASKPHHSK